MKMIAFIRHIQKNLNKIIEKSIEYTFAFDNFLPYFRKINTDINIHFAQSIFNFPLILHTHN